jgi:hypothetical protein
VAPQLNTGLIKAQTSCVGLSGRHRRLDRRSAAGVHRQLVAGALQPRQHRDAVLLQDRAAPTGVDVAVHGAEASQIGHRHPGLP